MMGITIPKMKYKINKIRNKLKKKVVKSATFNDADPYVEDMFEDVAVEDTDRIIYLLDQGFDKLKAKERFENMQYGVAMKQKPF